MAPGRQGCLSPPSHHHPLGAMCAFVGGALALCLRALHRLQL